jgi:effector-binding domain-containing protein
MKKLSLLALIVAVFFMQAAVSGRDYQKSGATLKGDTAKKSSQIKIEVKELEASKVLAIKATVKSNEVGAKMGELYPRLMKCLNESGIEMTGPPYSKYYTWDPEGETEMEVGIPVSGPAECEEDIEYIELPPSKVVTAMHIGPYEKIGPVYDAIQKYINENGMIIAGAVWEVYITDPNSEPDPEKYKTQVYFPVSN